MEVPLNAGGEMALLVHTDCPIHPIIDDQDKNWQTPLCSGCQLLDRHLQAPITSPTHDISIRFSNAAAIAAGNP